MPPSLRSCSDPSIICINSAAGLARPGRSVSQVHRTISPLQRHTTLRERHAVLCVAFCRGQPLLSALDTLSGFPLHQTIELGTLPFPMDLQSDLPSFLIWLKKKENDRLLNNLRGLSSVQHLASIEKSES